MNVQLTHPRADCLATWAPGFKRNLNCESGARQARPTKNKRVHITLIMSMCFILSVFTRLPPPNRCVNGFMADEDGVISARPASPAEARTLLIHKN